MNFSLVTLLLVVSSNSWAIPLPPTPSTENLINGVVEGEVLNSDTNLGGYAVSASIYSEIDVAQTKQAMQDLSLDVYMSFLEDYESWGNVYDISFCREYVSSCSGWPETLVVGIAEPENGNTSWDDEYIGISNSITGYEILDTYFTYFTYGLLFPGNLVPDALVLTEIDNLAAMAHRPVSVYTDRIAPDDVRDFIGTIQETRANDGLDREAWGYIGEIGALTVGMSSWALGVDPSGVVSFGGGDYTGLETPFFCRTGSNRPQGVLDETPDPGPSSYYYEVLMGIGVSFLHADMVENTTVEVLGPVARTEYLRLRAYLDRE